MLYMDREWGSAGRAHPWHPQLGRCQQVPRTATALAITVNSSLLEDLSYFSGT